MKLFFLQFFTIFLFQRYTYQHSGYHSSYDDHECSHSHINISEQISDDYFEHHIKLGLKNKRLLEEQVQQGIRITTDYSELDKIQDDYNLDIQQKSYIEKLLESSKTYFNKLIKVFPRQSPIVRRGNKVNSYECIDVIPSQQLITEGVKDSDLHIIVTFEYDGDSSYVANAGFCELEPSPIIGRIKFNVANMILKQEYFQQNIQTTIHELIHVLGFSGSAIPYWIDPETKMPYIKSGISSVSKILSKQFIRGVEDVYILSSKNVLETAREHFGCFNLEGLPLENQGGSESFGSHWEKDLLQNELMTASRAGKDEQVVLSQFTAALLRDTGFYAEINQDMVQTIEYGKLKGCNFVEYPCLDYQPEFSLEQLCELNSIGISPTYKNNYSECQQLITQSQSMCSHQSRYVQSSEVLRNSLGETSKCFRSTSVQYHMINKGEDYIRCHQYTCNLDFSKITIYLHSNLSVICKYPNQIIDLIDEDVETYGQLTCPSNFERFCSPTLSCPNNCHSRGLCNNGICYCSDGKIGGDCAQVLYQQSRICNIGFYENPDMSCRKECPDGYFGNKEFNMCIKCNLACSKCFGESENECLDCNKPYYLLRQTCIKLSAQAKIVCHPTCKECHKEGEQGCETCYDGRWKQGSGQCAECLPNCAKCTKGDVCEQCIPNYVYNKYEHACKKECHVVNCYNCKDNSDSICEQCIEGFYLANDKSCQKCDANCANCENNPTNCTSCIQGEFLDKKTCKKCDDNCATCETDADSCRSCADKKYIYNNWCYDCDSNCQKCSGDKKVCTLCLDDQFLALTTYLWPRTNYNKCFQCDGSCIKCSGSAKNCSECTNKKEAPNETTGVCEQCDPSCQACSKPNSETSCTECKKGEFLTGDNKCQKCSLGCLACEGAARNCSECDVKFKKNDVSNCVLECDPSCDTCTEEKNKNKCDSCIPLQYVAKGGINDGSCQPCEPPCVTCKSKTFCESCVAGYFIQDPTTGICQENCYIACRSCTKSKDPDSCTSCNDGYVIKGTRCEPCTSPCKNCINQLTECTSCISKDYIFSPKICTPICDPLCKTCTLPKDPTACLTCNDGMFLKGTTCVQCKSPCKNCVNDEDTCLSCVPTFELIKGGDKCKQVCHTSCVTCTKAYTGEFCVSCFEGTTLKVITANGDGTGMCSPCISPCKTCDIGDEKKCLSCITADYTYDKANFKCVPTCDASCVTCYEPKSSAACLSCEQGKYLINDQCRTCSSPCNTCEISGYKCLTCVDKYTIDPKTNACKPICHPSCLECYEPDDPKQCKLCPEKSYEYSGECRKCKEPCSKCQEKETKCIDCISKIYELDEYKYICVNKCDKSCKMCSEKNDPNKCISCIDGQFLTGKPEGACKPCKFPCITCSDSEDFCLTCAPNYLPGKVNKNTCEPICHQKCLTCSGPLLEKFCILCTDGLYSNGDKCVPCSSPCLTCMKAALTCLTCVTNYTHDSVNNVCNPICDNSCKACTLPKNPQKCSECDVGKYLNSKFECQVCQPPCKTCEYENFRCTSCISSEYTFIGALNKCQLTCDPTCLDCSIASNPNACISCAVGKYLTAQKTCEPCTQPCASCETSPTQCKTCIVGYNKDTTMPKCNMICHNTCKTCNTPFSEDGCTACDDGKYLLAASGSPSGRCLKCQSPCKNCVDKATFCLTCISDTHYTYIGSTGICKPICDRSCLTCSEPQNPKACLSCPVGYLLNQLKQCQQCQYPCGTCSAAINLCDSCVSADFTHESATKRCISDCHESCATCFLPYDEKQCKQCFDGYFLVSKTCQKCSPPCQNCENSSTQCTSCIDNYSLTAPSSPNVPKKCLPNCHDSCSTCDQPLDQYRCLTCYAGFFFDSSNQSCKKCQYDNCAICDKQQCISCLPNYQIDQKNKDAGCQPICDPSCTTCSKPIDPNACKTCADGKFVSFNSCQPCKSPCVKCSSETSCLSCEKNYDFKENQCIPICDESCETCSSPKDPKKCLTCPQNRFKDDQNQCVTCKPGELVTNSGCIICPVNCDDCDAQRVCTKCKDGYSVNSKGECEIQSEGVTCHFTCKTCLSKDYDACTSCVENRTIKKLLQSDSKVGMCECPDNTTDVNKAACEKSNVQKNVKSVTTGVYAASITVSSLGAVVSGNPLILVSLIEFSQTISFFTYVNEKPALGFDGVAQSLYIAHITKLFNFGELSNSNSRLLQQNQTQLNVQGSSEKFEHNTKLPQNEKYPQFIVNALAILILTAVIWLVCAFSSTISMSDPHSFTAKVRKVLCISLPICIFTLTSQEFSLLIFYQFQQMSFDTKLGSTSIIFTFIIFFYILGFLGYLFYKLEYKRVLQTPLNENQSILAQNQKVQDLFGSQTNLSDQQVIYNMEFYTFYILHLFINQNTFLNRNFVQIIVIRKIITSMLMVYGFKQAMTQMVILFIIYLFYWFYIILSKPFKQKRHRIVYTIIESITLLMHILYIALIDSDDAQTQKNISFAMIICIIAVVFVYLIVTFIYLALYIVLLIKKCGNKNDDIVANISNHFGQNQSHSSTIQHNDDTKSYAKNFYPNTNQMRKQQLPAYQEQMNSSVVHNQSMHFDQTNTKNGFKPLNDSSFVESPQRYKQPAQQQVRDHQLNHILNNSQNNTFNKKSNINSTNRVFLDPISNRGVNDNSQMQSGVQLYNKNQQSSRVQQIHNGQFQNNVSPQRVQGNTQPMQVSRTQQQVPRLQTATQGSKIYKENY